MELWYIMEVELGGTMFHMYGQIIDGTTVMILRWSWPKRRLRSIQMHIYYFTIRLLSNQVWFALVSDYDIWWYLVISNY